LSASLIVPDGPGGPAFLVYDNFRVLRRWNRSNSFAVAIRTLSDMTAKRVKMQGGPPESLRRASLHFHVCWG
ncbi:MAG: lytic murein transglycosylase, partial [Desulfuromonadales bacterium]